jgi:pilus assembly protein CpaF
MTMMSGINLSPREVRKIIGSAIQIIVHMQRFPDGSRKVVSITEIRGIDGGDDPQIIFNDLFIYKEDSRGGSGFDLRPVMRQYPLFHNQMKKMNLATDKVFLE